MGKLVLIGTTEDVREWMDVYKLSYSDVITAHGMLLGREFREGDVVVCGPLEGMFTDSAFARQRFTEWVRTLNTTMVPGHELPEPLHRFL